MNLDKYVGTRMRRLRQRKQIDRRRLAEIVGADPEAYAAYETGSRPLSAEMLFELACHFDVEVTYFFEGFEGVSVQTTALQPDHLRSKR